MKIHSLMGIDPDKRIIALAGGGGKTTSLYALAGESAKAGRRTVIMTTTHIGIPKKAYVDFYTTADPECFKTSWSKGRVVAVGKIGEDGRVIEPDERIYSIILREADAIYIEADGSKCLPLKYPDHYEPALPGTYDQVVVICGLSALDKPFDESCHRAELARKMIGITNYLVDESVMAKVLLSGYGKYNPIVVLNQADTEELKSRGQNIAELLYRGGIDYVSVLSLQGLLVI